jgi:hypothetical protein
VHIQRVFEAGQVCRPEEVECVGVWLFVAHDVRVVLGIVAPTCVSTMPLEYVANLSPVVGFHEVFLLFIVPVVRRHGKVPKVFFRNPVRADFHLALLGQSEESLRLLECAVCILLVDAMIDHVEETDAMTCFTNLFRYRSPVIDVVAMNATHVDDGNLIGFDRVVRVEVDLLSIA